MGTYVYLIGKDAEGDERSSILNMDELVSVTQIETAGGTQMVRVMWKNGEVSNHFGTAKDLWDALP